MSMLRLIIALLAIAPFTPAAEPPKGELPICPTDWKVELVAEAPKIKHPSVVCCAPDGRIFVGEDPMDMGNDSKKPTDRILCIHPDGKITVFAEELHAVFGMAYVDGKLFVHHVPKFSVFTDDNGVGKDRKDLIDCTNPNPAPGFNDHIPANIRLGMDGWFYMSTGDKGIYGAVGTDGSKAEIYGGGVMRFRPDGSKLEVFSSGTRNHLDVALNSEDEIFTYDNTDDGNGWWTRVTHMVDGGFYGYPWDYKPKRPYTLWMMTDYGGGSPTGAIAYNEDALPASYRGNLFLCEWGRKQLLRLDVTREGGSYKILSRDNFLTSGTKEFRPVGITISPDGMSFYVADWNFSGWKQNVTAGRLIKLTYTGKSEAAAKPDWYMNAAMGKPFQATLENLVEGLKHPAQSVRLVAQRRLAEIGQAAVKPVVDLMNDTKSPSFARWAAIWTLDAIDGGESSRTALIALLKDADASVRRQAARQAGTRSASTALPSLIGLLGDEDASVRFQAATALGRIGSSTAVKPLLKSLEQTDLFARYAAFTALNRIGRKEPQAWASIVAGLNDESTSIREGVQFAIRETFDAELVKALVQFSTDAKTSESTRVLALKALAELHRQPVAWKGNWWGTQPVKSPKPAGTVDWAGTPMVIKALAATLKDENALVRHAAAEGAAVAKDAEFVPALIQLFQKDTDLETRRAVLRAIAVNKNAAPAMDLVLGVLANPKENAGLLLDAVAAAERVGGSKASTALATIVGTDAAPETIARALTALGNLKAIDAIPTIASRLGSDDIRVRNAASDALTNIGGPAVTKALVPLLKDKKVEIRRLAIAALGSLKSPAAVDPLLQAFADPETKAEAVAALSGIVDPRAVGAYLFGLGSKNAPVRDACRKAILALRAESYPIIADALTSGSLTPEVVGELQSIYSTKLPVLWSSLGLFPVGSPLPFDVAQVPTKGDFKGIGDKKVRWKTPTGNDRTSSTLDLRKEQKPTEPAIAYALGELFSPDAGEVELTGRIDGGDLTLWLNGEIVHDTKKPEKLTIKAKLKAGKNVLLARSTYAMGGWNLSITAPAAKAGPIYTAKASKQIDPKAYSAFAVKNTGDAAKGKLLFADLKGLACAKCHKVSGGEGGEVGPDLAGVGAKYNREVLIESILLPSKQILDGYHQTVIDTASGKKIIGIVRGESPTEITLIDVENKKHVIKKDDIDDRKLSNLSAMPEGLHNGLSLEEFAHMIAYLESLKEKPPEKK
jgi:putative membrane-bound dehydrogenase-like protein